MSGTRASGVSTQFRPLCQFKYVHIRSGSALPAKAAWVIISDDTASSFCLFCLTSISLVYIIMFTVMAPRKPVSLQDAKAQALRADGALHPHPDAVQDELFQTRDFFDSRDRVQTKYEMLRRHRVDGKPIAQIAASFGTSRQAFYVAQAAFETRGLPGLLGRQRGPKQAHKCTDALLDFVEAWRRAPPADDSQTLTKAIQERFGVLLHPRSIDRALARRKKKSSAKDRYRS